MYATTDLSLIALRAFSASCAASHDPLAAVASSSASKFTVTLLIFVSAIAIWIELTISTVCVREAPVIGRLDMILMVFALEAPPPPRVLPPSTAAPRGAPSGLATGRVLYSSGGLDLWASAPDGTGRRPVTKDGSTGGYAGGRWSPDGSLVAAERFMPGEGGTALFLLRADGSSVRLTRVDTFLDGYVWSPDGRYLAYREVVSGATAAAGGLTGVGAVGDVHLYDVRAATDLVIGPGTHPAFSPDGTHLGFAHLAGAIASADLTGLAGAKAPE